MQRTEPETSQIRDGREASGRRRRVGLVAFLAVAALVAGIVWFVAAQVSLGVTKARADIEERLGALAGQPVAVDGTVSFQLLPSPRATLTDVRVVTAGASEPYSVEIDVVLAELDVIDALLGRTVIDRLTFIRPEGFPGGTLPAPPAVPATAPDSSQPPSAAADEDGSQRARALARAFLGRFEGVRRLVVRDGALRTADGGNGLSSINVDFTWPDPSRAAGLTGNLVWNGEPAEIDLRLDDPAQLRDGGPSRIDLAIEAPSVAGSFAGTGSLGDTADIAGRLRVETPSIARAARWLGTAPANLPDFGAFALETDIRLGTGRLNLEAVTLDVGGFTGRGVLEAARNAAGRIAVGGTLAFDRLAVDRFARAIAPVPRNALDLQRPIAVAFVRNFDLDLRLSAAEATILSQPVRDLAATVKLNGGIATLDIGDAEFLGGRAAAHVSLDATAARPHAVARVALTGAEANEILPVLGVQAIAVAGRSNLDATFEGPVANWADILRRNVVDATIETRDGTFSGLDPATILSPGERRLGDGAAGGSVPFQSFSARVATRGSAARFRSIRIDGPGGVIEATGTMSFLTDHIALDGIFRPASETASRTFTPSQPLRFTIGGEWPDPVVSVAAQDTPI